MGNSCSPGMFASQRVKADTNMVIISRKSPNGIQRRSQNDFQNNNDGIGMGLIGLNNLGNSCYFNSAIQCLSNTVAFTNYFIMNDSWKKDINKENPSGKEGEFALYYGKLINDIWTKRSNNKKCLSPDSLFDKLIKHESRFSGRTQQDVQELISTLLDGIHEDLNKVKCKPYVLDLETDGLQNNDHEIAKESWRRYLLRNKSIVVDIFQGQLKTTVKCLTCSKIKIKFDPFMYLTLPIPPEGHKSLSLTSASSRQKSITIYDCLDRFNVAEEMRGSGSQWHCPSCKVLRDSELTIETWKTPHILIIHLKRFIQQSPGRRRKITTFVDFDMELDMSKYVKSGDSCTQEYELYAISNHHGSLHFGHYTCFAKNRCNNKWYFFDDSSCTEVEESQIITSSAYLLFYCSKSVDNQNDRNYSIYGNLNNSEDDIVNFQNDTADTKCNEASANSSFANNTTSINNNGTTASNSISISINKSSESSVDNNSNCRSYSGSHSIRNRNIVAPENVVVNTTDKSNVMNTNNVNKASEKIDKSNVKSSIISNASNDGSDSDDKGGKIVINNFKPLVKSRSFVEEEQLKGGNKESYIDTDNSINNIRTVTNINRISSHENAKNTKKIMIRAERTYSNQ